MDTTAGIGLDSEDVAKSAYIVSHLQKLREIIELADQIYAGFPKLIKEQIGHTIEPTCIGETLTESVSTRLAMQIAMHPAMIREDMRNVYDEIIHFVSVWFDDKSAANIVDDDDLAVIVEMVEFVQRIGSKSTRQLLNFLRASNADEWGNLLISSHGRSSEIRHRYSLNDETARFFDIESQSKIQ